MRSDLGSEVLDLAAAPDGRLNAVLAHALRELSAVAGAGAAALLVFDPVEGKPTLVAAATHGVTATAPELFFQHARRDPGARLERVCGDGRPSAVADHRQAATGPALSPDSRASLWLPLLEHRRAVALLVLEAGRADAFREALVLTVGRAAREILPGLQRALLRHFLQQAGAPVDVVGRSPAFLELERQIRLAGAFAEGSVLVTGERGSGKELVAWAIHAWSRRRGRPFVPLLAAACSDALTVDELFGHERHAFTGAADARPGKFQAADGGTLMLDEAGDLPPAIQPSFLRVLELGELQRIGRDAPLRVDVRVVAATNRDLVGLMAEGRFRRDLYDRLSFFEVQVPPLRERREDIPLLARHFLRAACANTWRSAALARDGHCAACEALHPGACASRDFFAALEAYAWPGNVRELRQVIGRLVATVPDEVLDLPHVPESLRCALAPAAPTTPAAPDQLWSLDAAVRRHIEKALLHTGANQSESARLLGLPLSTLRSKMKKLGVALPRPR